MRKTLTRVGNSHALLLDRTLMDLLHLDKDTPVDVEVQGDTMLVRAARPNDEKRKRVLDVAERLMNDHDETFRKLAK